METGTLAGRRSTGRDLPGGPAPCLFQGHMLPSPSAPPTPASRPAGRVVITNRRTSASILGLTLVLALSVMWSAPLAAQDQATRSRPEVKRLVLRGVESVDEEELRGSIATRASSCRNIVFRVLLCPFSKSGNFWDRHFLDRLELRRDVVRVQAFYWLRGYRDTQVDTLVVEESGNEVTVVFGIREGPPTRTESVVVQGADSILAPAARERLSRPRTGEPFNYLLLDSSRVAVQNALWELGYADAIVDTSTVVRRETRTATARILVNPRWITRVGSITVRGLEELEPAAVRRRLMLSEGDVFTREAAFESQRRLYESGLFRRATLSTTENDSIRNLTVTVEEADLRSVELRAGFSTIDFVQTEASFVHQNFLGGTRRFEARAGVGNLLARTLEDRFIFSTLPFPETFDGDRDAFMRPTWQVSMDLRQPAAGSPRNTLSLTTFTHRRSAPGIYVDQGFGAGLTFTREVMLRVPVSLGYTHEITRVDAGSLYFCVNFNVCDPRTIAALQSNASLSPVMLTAQSFRWNDPLNPTRGYTAQVTLEHASGGTLSDFSYHRATLEGTAYRPFGGGTLAGRVRMGAVSPIGSGSSQFGGGDLLGRPIVHPRKVFFAGGSRSVRGFGENLLGPKILTIPPSALDSIGCSYPYDSCNVNVASAEDPDEPVLSNSRFTPRPLGARAVLEGSVEFRFPLAGPVEAAVFVDGAVLGNSLAEAFKGQDAAFTPGLGIRYLSPVGPIRVDVGLNPTLVESLPVATQLEQDGVEQLALVRAPDGNVAYRRFTTYSRSLLSRAVLHLSIGQAF
jgi:outer membrane protein assembly factor BamA